jgi:hypothetical protein
MGLAEQNAQHHTTAYAVPTTAIPIVSIPTGSLVPSAGISIPITIIQNQGATDVYIGPVTVTNSGANIGIVIKGGQTPPDKLILNNCGNTWACSASATPNVVVDLIY